MNWHIIVKNVYDDQKEKKFWKEINLEPASFSNKLSRRHWLRIDNSAGFHNLADSSNWKASTFRRSSGRRKLECSKILQGESESEVWCLLIEVTLYGRNKSANAWMQQDYSGWVRREEKNSHSFVEFFLYFKEWKSTTEIWRRNKVEKLKKVEILCM